MIMKTSIDDLPPFPEDVPIAPIASISLKKLLAGDDAEGQKVLVACKTDGFFYLNMTDSSEGQALLDESERLRELATETFKSPIEEKKKFVCEITESLFGYKEAGTIKKTDKDRRPDTTEFFNIAKDHLHGIAPSRPYPTTIEAAKPLLQDFTKNAHTCGMLVLRTLAKQFGLPPNAFVDLNNFTSPSGDHCRLTRQIPEYWHSNAIGLPSHTDFGSITILFNWLGGLQIQSNDPQKVGEWEFVKPIPGYAIINLGDGMVKFTNGELKSGKHRVVPTPGKQANIERYSVVYFVRPANHVLMVPLEAFRAQGDVKVGGKIHDILKGDGDKVYTAGEWMINRGKQLAS